MTVKIVLDPESEAIAKRQVEAGFHASADAAVRAGLRLLQERQPYGDPAQIDALRRAVSDGSASGPNIPAEQVFAELRARIRAVTGEKCSGSVGGP